MLGPHSTQTNFPKLKIGVVGHVEWMTFIEVNAMPKAGIITHSIRHKEEPAGGGAVTAIKIAELVKQEVHFYTALGNDELGEKSYSQLTERGLKLHVAWREEPTRKGISFIDGKGERSITVIGKRLQPSSHDNLPWQELNTFDGVFITAADYLTINQCRAAKKLLATPRVKIEEIQKANIKLDVLIGSALDPDERIPIQELKRNSKVIITTRGAEGGESFPGGKYKAIKPDLSVIDSYGCGDSFAAGVTTGIAAGFSTKEAIQLGASCGAICATHFGPYL